MGQQPRELDPARSPRALFGYQLRRLREDLGLSQEGLGLKVHLSGAAIGTYEKGRSLPTEPDARRLDAIVAANGLLLATWQLAAREPGHADSGPCGPGVSIDAGQQYPGTEDTCHAQPQDDPPDPALTGPAPMDVWMSGARDEQDALELARRISASDMGEETIRRLEEAFDDLAIAYAVTPPAELIERLRIHLAYVSRLMNARKTLGEYRRLLVVGGWLSLLAATVHIDLKQQVAATARLRTAASLAQHADHSEIRAWCLETSAWRAVTDQNYPRAVKFAQAAQEIAPTGSSAQTQATAQEGRAWARLHQASETYDAMERVRALVSARPLPDQPGHHYQYDPDKVTAYCATTLAWLGDPAAETHARQLITRLGNGHEGTGKWPRRVASARLDLALTLLGTDRLDEAAAEALTAIGSGHVAPSNYWRALEVVTAVEKRGLTEAADLREAYEALRTSRAPLPSPVRA